MIGQDLIDALSAHPERQVLVAVGDEWHPLSGHTTARAAHVVWTDDSRGWWPAPLELTDDDDPDIVKDLHDHDVVLLITDHTYDPGVCPADPPPASTP